MYCPSLKHTRYGIFSALSAIECDYFNHFINDQIQRWEKNN